MVLRFIRPGITSLVPVPQRGIDEPALEPERRIGGEAGMLALVVVDAALAIGLDLGVALDPAHRLEAALLRAVDLHQEAEGAIGVGARASVRSAEIERVGGPTVEPPVDARYLAAPAPALAMFERHQLRAGPMEMDRR